MLKHFQIFFSLHEKRKVAVSLDIFNVIWQYFEILEFLKKLCVVLEAIQWPSHLAFYSLIQFFLLVRIFHSLLFYETFSDLDVALTFL